MIYQSTDSRATGTGGPYAGQGVTMSCCLCHRHRPTGKLALFRKGLKLKRCKDAESCDEARKTK